MEDGADGDDICIDVSKMLDDFGKPFGKTLAGADGPRGAGGLGIVEDDFRGAVSVRCDAANLRPGSIGFDLDGRKRERLNGEMAFAVFMEKTGQISEALFQFRADGAEALAGLAFRRGKKEDVFLALEDQVVKDEAEADHRGLCRSARRGQRIAAPPAMGQRVPAHFHVPSEQHFVHGGEGQPAMGGQCRVREQGRIAGKAQGQAGLALAGRQAANLLLKGFAGEPPDPMGWRNVNHRRGEAPRLCGRFPGRA